MNTEPMLPPVLPRRPRQISGTQVMFAVIVAIGLMLAINFSSRVTADRQLRDVQIAVEREIELLRIEQGQLAERLQYVQGDAYVESWARSEGRMVREGEVLVIPIQSNTTLPIVETPTPAPLVFDEQDNRVQQWHLWWALFFDSPPPQF